MIIEATLMFGVLLAFFEFVLLGMIPPRYRLRLLGSNALCNLVHVAMMVANLYVHWGTVIGTMSATLSFVMSILTVKVARLVYGSITNNVRTRRGLLSYKNAELML